MADSHAPLYKYFKFSCTSGITSLSTQNVDSAIIKSFLAGNNVRL